MSATVQVPPGSAHVQYRLVLPDRSYLNFDPARVLFVEAVIQDEVNGNSKCNHVFRVLDPSFVPRLIEAMAQADPEIHFRLGYGDPSQCTWLPWQKHLVVDHFSRPEGLGPNSGNLVVINTNNALARNRRVSRVVARNGILSDVVKAIATANGMDSVVEPTDGKFTLYQCFQDDISFMFERVLPRAINKQGRGGYFLFVRDNVLHFHTLDYQASVIQVDYYNTTATSFETLDRSQQVGLWDAGLSGVTMIVQDPYSGVSKEVASDPTRAVKLADGIYKYGAISGSSRNFPYHLGANPVLEVEALAQFYYQRARAQVFRSVFTSQQNILIRHGDILSVILAQQGTRSSSYAGYHYVVAATHSIKKGNVTSAYTLERGEIQPQKNYITVQDAGNMLQPETTAPGVFPNLREVQSSQLTKGAGNEASARTFADLADPQTGR